MRIGDRGGGGWFAGNVKAEVQAFSTPLSMRRRTACRSGEPAPLRDTETPSRAEAQSDRALEMTSVKQKARL